MRRLFAAILTGVIVCVSACTTSVGGTPVADPKATVRPTEPSGPVRLTVMTYGDQGYEELLRQYESEHEGVTVQLQKVDIGAYYPKLQVVLTAGTAPDVVVIGENNRAEFFGKKGAFADLAEVGPDDVRKDRWPDWTYKAGKAKDGTWVGYGTDSGPFGMAYRTDLFAAAGLPTDPKQVGELFKSWDSYLAAGDQYVRATGKPWFDSGADVFTAMDNQRGHGYVDDNGTLTLGTDKDIRAIWDTVTGAVGRGQSAKLAPFAPEWNAGFRSGAFATVPAPYWMLSLIKTNAGPDNAGKWAIADTFPGGGANWGGDYLAVPSVSKHAKQAAELAAWLSAPEQQLAAFRSVATFPSQVDALGSDELRGASDSYFATADTGRIYADLAGKVTVAPYPSPRDSVIQNQAMAPALQGVERGGTPDAGWQQAVAKAQQIVAG